MFEIKGKVALITGGISGIGLSIARELLENKLKAVTLIDINEDLGVKVSEDMKQKYGNNNILFVKADIRDKNTFEDAFKTTVQTFKHLDIVVNCAGISKERKIEEVIDVNFKGTVYGCLLALDQYLPEHKSGTEAVILNVASITGITPYHFIPVYSGTKCAIVGLTRALGTDPHYQRTRVKVVAVCPGVTETPMANVDEDTFLSPVYKELQDSSCQEFIIQSPSCVAKASLFIISEAENGSVWVVKDKKPPYQVTW